MMTALECRQQSVFYRSAAKAEDHAGIRAALIAINRSWVTIANQMDRLAELRHAEGRPH